MAPISSPSDCLLFVLQYIAGNLSPNEVMELQNAFKVRLFQQWPHIWHDRELKASVYQAGLLLLKR